jgi:hypothetical protein
MTDLDDVTYPTRSKTDLVQRERELYLVLRMMDIEKRELWARMVGKGR